MLPQDRLEAPRETWGLEAKGEGAGSAAGRGDPGAVEVPSWRGVGHKQTQVQLRTEKTEQMMGR